MTDTVEVYSIEGVPLVKLHDHRAVDARKLCDDIVEQAQTVEGTRVPRDVLTAGVVAGMAILSVLDKEGEGEYANRSNMALIRSWFHDVPEDASGSDVVERIKVMIDGDGKDEVRGVWYSMSKMSETPKVGTSGYLGVDAVSQTLQAISANHQTLERLGERARQYDKEHPLRLLFEALERVA